MQARLLLEERVTTGYEVLPVARINRAASPQAPPRIDRTYVPPILGIDAWVSLNEEVQALFRQIEAWIQQEATQIVGRRVAFDSQILGDAERILRLSVLNTASATFQSVIFTQGLHPLLMYQELCRLLGQLSIFGETRRPIKINSYDHDNIGPIYVEVITEIRACWVSWAMSPSTSDTSSSRAADSRFTFKPTGPSRPPSCTSASKQPSSLTPSAMN